MKNAGYQIIRREFYTKTNAIVIAKNEKAVCSTFVTWEYRKDTDSYFWGHYFNNEREAMKDYHERLKDQYDNENTPF